MSRIERIAGCASPTGIARGGLVNTRVLDARGSSDVTCSAPDGGAIEANW
jgi:hypothetical protein